MPGDLSIQGDNPFFLGYREQDPTTGLNPQVPGNKKARPLDEIWKMVYKMDPTLTRHDRDLLAHRMDLEGLTELFGKPGFQDGLKALVTQISSSPSRVVAQYLASRRANEI